MPDLLEVTRGDTPTIRVGPVKRDGAVVNLTGATAELTVKDEPTGDPALFTKTGTLADITAENDGFEFVLDAADTDDLAGDYVWDVQLEESGGRVTTFPKHGPGVFRVLADVNRT